MKKQLVLCESMVVMMLKTYSELMALKTFKERFEYLKLNGVVSNETFGFDRYLNQKLYKSREWKSLRDKIIMRDDGCDLGDIDRPIHGKIIIHHLNPISREDLLNMNPIVFDPNNLICCSHITHNAIHYSEEDLLPSEPIQRQPGDTKLW